MNIRFHYRNKHTLTHKYTLNNLTYYIKELKT